MFALIFVFSPFSMAHDVGVKACHVIAERVHDSFVQVCSVVFMELLWQGEVDYIQTTGYVVLIDNYPYMFASKDLYFYSGGRGGVAIDVHPSEFDRFNRIVSEGLPITVAGLYNPVDVNGKGLIGRIEVIGRHYWLQELLGDRPRLPED